MRTAIKARWAVAVATALLTTAVLAVTAAADTTVGSDQVMRVQRDPGASGCNPDAGSTYGWVTGNDAPGDNNSKLFRVHVGTGGCIIVYSNASYNRHVLATNQKNLSYEFATETEPMGAGQFYLAVEFNNGDVAFLDPAYCHHSIAVSGGTWQRSDFTGFRNDCGFFVSDNSMAGQTRYNADGTHSAWAVYNAANPDQLVVHKYMVFSFNDHKLDRISLGAGKMYTKSRTTAVSCTTEASC